MTQSFSDRVAIALSTVFGIGLAPIASGTFGSLPGLAVGALFNQIVLWMIPEPAAGLRFALTAGLIALLTALAYWAIHRTEAAWLTHDDGRIVIDEVVGQVITIAFLPLSAFSIVTGFFLFRFMDILKPLGAGWIDRHGPGAFGTLFDDVLAGIYAALVLWGLLAYFS